MYIVKSRVFEKEYRKLPQRMRAQATERLTLFSINRFHPLLHNHPLHHPFIGCNSITISSDIRAIYQSINDDVVFIRIGTHSELYE